MRTSSNIDQNDSRWGLVEEYILGNASAEVVSKLEHELTQDQEFRTSFLRYLDVDSGLEQTVIPDTVRRNNSRLPKRAALLLPIFGAACVAVLGLLAIWQFKPDSANAAVVEGASADIRWLSPPAAIGDPLSTGAILNLASGKLKIAFDSGAWTEIHGPAQFEIVSSNSGFLHYGDAFSRADNEASHGFTIHTHSGNFVDQGTEFLTSASLDGYSQLHVTSGEVDVDVPGHEVQRLKKGSGFGIEPGEVPVMIRIEPGQDSPAFKFPSIAPPGSHDYADRSQGHANVEWSPTNASDRKNHLALPSGPPELLLDGRAQTSEDRPDESLFFRDGANGIFVIDLGNEVPVSRIHTYSWHRNWEDPDLRRRAVQRFTLWGCGSVRPSTIPNTEDGGGWTRIARVNTDAFFGVQEEPDRPPQQACAIFSGNNSIGKFRYLLFEVSPTPMPDGARPRHTFFGEIDVFVDQKNYPESK